MEVPETRTFELLCISRRESRRICTKRMADFSPFSSIGPKRLAQFKLTFTLKPKKLEPDIKDSRRSQSMRYESFWLGNPSSPLDWSLSPFLSSRLIHTESIRWLVELFGLTLLSLPWLHWGINRLSNSSSGSFSEPSRPNRSFDLEQCGIKSIRAANYIELVSLALARLDFTLANNTTGPQKPAFNETRL